MEPEVDIKGKKLVSLWFKDESGKLTETLPRNCQFHYRGCLVDSAAIKISLKAEETPALAVPEKTKKAS